MRPASTIRRRLHGGQALIEFAIVVPLVFLLIINVVNFAGLFSAWITVSRGSRSAVQYLITGPAYAGYGTSSGLSSIPSASTIAAVLTNCATVDGSGNARPLGDLCSLPNQASISVSVCTNNQSTGTATIQTPETCLPPTNPSTGSPYEDPEPGTSVVGTVQVTYRYCPFIPFWEFPRLGIHSTLASCTGGGTAGGTPIRRTAVMRMVQ